MEIRWDAETVMESSANVKDAFQALDGCLARFGVIREALEDAMPSENDRAFSHLVEVFEACESKLQVEAQNIEQIIAGMEAAVDAFEEAEDSIIRQINLLDGHSDLTVSRNGIKARADSDSNISPGIADKWIPEPVILPRGINRTQIIPEWLEIILDSINFLEE